MRKMQGLVLLLPQLLMACATAIPVASQCPQPPPVPSVLTSPVTQGPSLSERLEVLLKQFEDSLTRAAREP